jgi:hypothetical protein
MSDGPPEGYRLVDPSENLDDLDDGSDKKDASLVKTAIEAYRKKSCKIYIAKDRWPGKKKKGDTSKKKNADLIISCDCDRCKTFVVLIECKGGKWGVDKGVKQLEEASKAASDNKLIPAKITEAQLKVCFHSVLFVTDDFEQSEENKAANPGSETPFDGKKKTPKVARKTKDLPMC